MPKMRSRDIQPYKHEVEFLKIIVKLSQSFVFHCEETIEENSKLHGFCCCDYSASGMFQ